METFGQLFPRKSGHTAYSLGQFCLLSIFCSFSLQIRRPNIDQINQIIHAKSIHGLLGIGTATGDEGICRQNQRAKYYPVFHILFDDQTETV